MRSHAGVAAEDVRAPGRRRTSTSSSSRPPRSRSPCVIDAEVRRARRPRPARRLRPERQRRPNGPAPVKLNCAPAARNRLVSGRVADAIATARTASNVCGRWSGPTRARPPSWRWPTRCATPAGTTRPRRSAAQGLGQHPRLVTGQVALGRALLQRGRLREAQDVLVDAAKSSPEHGDAFRWLGELGLRKGDPDHARPILEYAEELMPTDAPGGRAAGRGRAASRCRGSAAPRPTSSTPGWATPGSWPSGCTRTRRRRPPRCPGCDPADLDDKTPGGHVARGRHDRRRHAGARDAPRATPRSSGPAVAAACSALAALAAAGRWGGAGGGRGRWWWCWLLPARRARAGAAARPVASAPRPRRRRRRRVDFKAAIAAGDAWTACRTRAPRASGCWPRQALDPDGAAAAGAGERAAGQRARAEHAWPTPRRPRSRRWRRKPVLARTGLAESARALAALAAGRLAAGQGGRRAGAHGRRRTAPRRASPPARVNVHLGAVDEARADLEAATKAAPKLTAARAGSGGPAHRRRARPRRPSPTWRRCWRPTRICCGPACCWPRPGGRPCMPVGRRRLARGLPGGPARERGAAGGLRVRPGGGGAAGGRSRRGAEVGAGRGGGPRPPRERPGGRPGRADDGHPGRRRQRRGGDAQDPGGDRAGLRAPGLGGHGGGAGAGRQADGRPTCWTGPAARRPGCWWPGRPSPRAAAGAGRGPGQAGARRVEFDPDLKAVRDPGRRGQAAATRRASSCQASAEKGSSLASYVLGPARPGHGQQAKAAERLAKALQGHGDSCEAAHLLLTIDRKQRPSAVNSEAKVAKLVRGPQRRLQLLREAQRRLRRRQSGLGARAY